MGNKPDQSSMFRLPQGTVHTKSTNGGYVVRDYGKEPVDCTYNPDRGQRWPRDPQRSREK